MKATVVFQCGGPYHPTCQQAELLKEWLPQGLELHVLHSTDAFDVLPKCDLFIAAGLNWSGLGKDGASHDWKDDTPHGYQPATELQKQNFRHYVASGKPVLGYHGGIASYDDWPEFGRLLGTRWDWRVTNHGPVGEWAMSILDPDHPIACGVDDDRYVIRGEEVYVNLQIAPDADLTVICEAELQGAKFPILFAGEGGRCAGSGRWAYFGNGHSMEAAECPAFRQLLTSTISWLLAD